MSSLEKRHTSRRGSMQGHHKYSDCFSDTSSVGSFMDETDREVSNLTDRAFRSLCIGEEAIYNDSEISSPAERHKAFSEEVQQKDVLKTTCQETFAYGIQYGEAERKSEVTSTFQHSYVDVAQQQFLRGEHMSYMSNGSVEATWQQKRSTSRVSSLIKAFSSREGYYDSGIPDAVLLRDNYRDINNGSWDKSALLSIQRELSEFSSAYHQNFRTYPFESNRNNFNASASMMTQQADTTASFIKSSNTKFHALNSTNFFFHSEYSPFQLWKDYNRFPFERAEPSGFLSANEFPRWYDSPLYKELTASHTFSSEGRRFNRRKIEDVVPTQRSRSTVIQKASAIEKRCESEISSNGPPWRRNNNLMRSKLPVNRPSTVSPTNEKTYRSDSTFLSHNRTTYVTQSKLEKVGGSELSSSSTPFSITQLLTPVVHGRQETETSEILQYAQRPSAPDNTVQSDVDLKLLPDVKQLRDGYKSKASSLLFNLKDNRKRVKSTYSPSKFKGLEITDRNKQPSKLEDIECRLSDSSASQVTIQKHPALPDTWEFGDVAQQNSEVCSSQTVEYKQYADGLHDNVTLAPQYYTDNYELYYGGSHANFIQPQNKVTGNSEGEIYGPSGKPNPRRPEIETTPSKVSSLSTQISEKPTFSRREDLEHCERQNFLRKSNCTYSKNVGTEERFYEHPEPINAPNKEIFNNNEIKDLLPFKGEIATLIERDKQRKAAAKQYLPSANNTYTTGKDIYVNKVNENIKQARLAKEEEVLDTDVSLQKYTYTRYPAQYNPTNVPSASQNLYGFHNNSPNIMTSSPPKASKLIRNSETRSTTHDKSEVCFQRDVNYPTYDTTHEHFRKILSSASLEEKHQTNEGSIAFQPYKYEPNKQWHIAASENRHTLDEELIPRQLQLEKKSEQLSETNYTKSVSGTSDSYQKNTVYSRTALEGKTRTEEYNQIYQAKNGDMKTDIKKQNIQNIEANNNNAQAREDKFSINDILSVRDNEQAKKIRENKHSSSAGISDTTKVQIQASLASSAEEQAAKYPNTYEKHENTNMLYGYIRKGSHNPNEELTNNGTTVKNKSEKETFMSKDNDKITSRTLSYKERGQTKQEILTSKLKAHAQKEISAIKEKELAKQGVLSRNPAKQCTNNEKGQMSQEVKSPKKEITAEKLNHLFQDITYSSVTLYKEYRNHDKDVQQYEPQIAGDMKSSTTAISPLAEPGLSEKNSEAVKDDQICDREKESSTTKVQTLTQWIQPQDEKITAVNKTTCEVQNKFSTSITNIQKEQSVNQSVNHETNFAQTSPKYSDIRSPNKEVSFTKPEYETTPNVPPAYSASITEYPTFPKKGKDNQNSPIFGKTKACSLTSYNGSQQDKLFDYSVEEVEPSSDINVDKHAMSSVTSLHNSTDWAETTILPVENSHSESECNTGKEKSLKEQNENKIGTGSEQEKCPLDWTRLKDEAATLESNVESTDSRTDLSTKHKANSAKEGEELKSEHGAHNTNEVSLISTDLKLPMTPEAKNELCVKQDDKVDSIPQIIKDSIVQPLQHVDTDPTIITCENAYENKGSQAVKPISVDLYESSLLKDAKPKEEEDLHSVREPQVLQLKQETLDTNNQSSSIVKTDAVTESNSQQLQKGSENLTERQRDLHEQIVIESKEMKQSTESKEMKQSMGIVQRNNSTPPSAENDSPEKPKPLNTMINKKDEQINSQTLQVKTSDIINPESECQVIHISNKEDNTQVDEPIIYSICVSSKSEEVSEDEPVIYSICVSSISDTSKTDVPVSQDKSSFEQKEFSTEGAEKEEETSGSPNEETAAEIDYLKNKLTSNEEPKECFSTNEAKKETETRKKDSSPTKDIHDSHRPHDVNNISSSYESLFVKHGLSIKENVHLIPEQKEEDKMQRKENKESANSHKSQTVQKNITDDDSASSGTVFGSHGPESNKSKHAEEVTKLLKQDEENKQYITPSLTANEEPTPKIAGIMKNSDENIKDIKQLTPENRAQNEQGVTIKQMTVTACEDNQNTQIIDSSKQNKIYGSVLQMGNTQVGQKVQVMDVAKEKVQKEIQNDNILSQNADTVQVKNENENLKNPVDGITYANISNNTTVTCHQLNKDSLPPSSKISVIIIEDSKVSETTDEKKAHTYFHSRVPPPDTDIHLYKCKPDKPSIQDSSKAVTETDNVLLSETTSEIPSPIQDKASQNRKEFVWRNLLSLQEPNKCNTDNETKDIKESGISNISNKETSSENCSVSEDLHYNYNVVKINQGLVKTPNILIGDKIVNKNELRLNKDILTAHNNLIGQQEHSRTDKNAKDTVFSKNADSQDTSQKEKLAATTKDVSKSQGIQKGTGESTPKQKEYMKDENMPLNKEYSKNAMYLVKVEKDMESESDKDDKNLKEITTQPLDKNDEVIAVSVRKDDGQTKSKVGVVVVKDSSDIVRKDTASSGENVRVKHDDHTNVYQYHPGKGFLPETKGNKCDEESVIQPNHHNRVHKKVESDRKTTRPEISALADYARLRVISAEDDSTSEKDLLEKMDTCHKYNLSAVDSQKETTERHKLMFVSGTEPKRELTVNKNNQSESTKPKQTHDRDKPLFQRSKITETLLEKQNQHTPRDEALTSLAKKYDNSKDKTAKDLMQPTSKTTLNEQHSRYQRRHEIRHSQNTQVQHNMPSHSESKNDDVATLKQPIHVKQVEKDICPPVKNQEILPETLKRSIVNTVNKLSDTQNLVQAEINEGEKVEELEYYTVSTKENDPNPKEIHETSQFSYKIASQKDATEIPTTGPRSNSSSPAMGKPAMFIVKDNTNRTTSVSKSVKPRFYRSFSEEFRIGSPKEIWNTTEKRELEQDQKHDLKVSANSPVVQEAVALHQNSRAKELQSQNRFSSAEFTATKGQKSYHSRGQGLEDEETRSVTSTMSEDVESFAGSSMVTRNSRASSVFEMKSNRDMYVRPESACYVRPESACYERPESVCYDRPESACSDMRPLGRPPTVPPKTEKALRRAKKLTTRRIQKTDTTMSSDSQRQLESKSIRTVSSLPSSPRELMSAHHAIHASPPVTQYHVEPNYAPPAPGLVAHPFPVTQRKLLQDPNSGQYFMVDMPVQVKTKTFFDPETGKYVQLNVRQRAQSTLSQPQSVSKPSYVVYPGHLGVLPVSVSSLPSVRSTSQMSAPATYVVEPNKLEASKESLRQDTHLVNYRKTPQQYNKSAQGTQKQSDSESLYRGSNVNISSRNTDIITMSELEDFAMEST